MDRLMKALTKWTLVLVVILALLPAVLHLLAAVLSLVIRWVGITALILGVVAGLSAAVAVGRRLAARKGPRPLPSDILPFVHQPVRRPRGIRGRDRGA